MLLRPKTIYLPIEIIDTERVVDHMVKIIKTIAHALHCKQKVQQTRKNIMSHG